MPRIRTRPNGRPRPIPASLITLERPLHLLGDQLPPVHHQRVAKGAKNRGRGWGLASKQGRRVQQRREERGGAGQTSSLSLCSEKLSSPPFTSSISLPPHFRALPYFTMGTKVGTRGLGELDKSSPAEAKGMKDCTIRTSDSICMARNRTTYKRRLFYATRT